jgi:hypothetical protein
MATTRNTAPKKTGAKKTAAKKTAAKKTAAKKTPAKKTAARGASARGRVAVAAAGGGGNGEDPPLGDEWFSDMTKFWIQSREQVEGFARKYLSPSAPPDPTWPQSLMGDSTNFVAQLWLLWTRGTALTALESGRLVAEALQGKNEKARP